MCEIVKSPPAANNAHAHGVSSSQQLSGRLSDPVTNSNTKNVCDHIAIAWSARGTDETLVSCYPRKPRFFNPDRNSDINPATWKYISRASEMYFRRAQLPFRNPDRNSDRNSKCTIHFKLTQNTYKSNNLTCIVHFEFLSEFMSEFMSEFLRCKKYISEAAEMCFSFCRNFCGNLYNFCGNFCGAHKRSVPRVSRCISRSIPVGENERKG